jgi:hypothetical protein
MERILQDLQKVLSQDEKLLAAGQDYVAEDNLHQLNNHYFHTSADVWVSCFADWVNSHNVSQNMQVRHKFFPLLTALLKSLLKTYYTLHSQSQKRRSKMLTCVYNNLVCEWGLSRTAFVSPFIVFFLISFAQVSSKLSALKFQIPWLYQVGMHSKSASLLLMYGLYWSRNI